MIFGIKISIAIVVMAILTFIWYCKDLITAIILQEQILQAIGIFFVHISFIQDDMMGSTITLFLLPLAGAESAIAQAQLIAYYPLRGTIRGGPQSMPAPHRPWRWGGNNLMVKYWFWVPELVVRFRLSPGPPPIFNGSSGGGKLRLWELMKKKKKYVVLFSNGTI